MPRPLTSLRLPATLGVVLLGGVAACSSPVVSPDGSTADAATCSIPAPNGRQCETTCYEDSTVNPPQPCEVFCDIPAPGAGSTACYTATGAPADCALAMQASGNYAVIC